MLKSKDKLCGYRYTEVVIGLVFIILKLTEQLDWHWIYITAPIWISPTFFLLGAALFVMYENLSDLMLIKNQNKFEKQVQMELQNHFQKQYKDCWGNEK
jgi:hypothetical protein